MLYLVTCILGLLAGIAAKGTLENVSCFRFAKVYLLAAGFAIQLAARLFSLMEVTFIKQSSMLVYGLVFLFIAAFIWFNRSYKGVLIIGLGYLMNSLVMMLNDGKMPVSLETLEKYGLTYMIDALAKEIDGKHTLLTEGTKLPWLADIIHPPYILGKFMEVASIGDMLIAFGLGVLMFEIIKGKKNNTEVVKCLN